MSTSSVRELMHDHGGVNAYSRTKTTESISRRRKPRLRNSSFALVIARNGESEIVTVATKPEVSVPSFRPSLVRRPLSLRHGLPEQKLNLAIYAAEVVRSPFFQFAP